MSGSLGRNRRLERREATRQEIVQAAWDLVRDRGLGDLAMRDLGERVGMRAQSLYVYFPSKHALLDAMYADGSSELLRRVCALEKPPEPVAALRAHTRTFLQFAVEDLPRYQLMFQRVIPGFEPTQESYAIAVQGLSSTRALLAACGASSETALDLYTALVAGIAAQQNSNDPGGDRWTRLLDEAIDMYLAHVTARNRPGGTR